MNDANNIQGFSKSSSFDDGSVRTIIVKEKVNWWLIALVLVIVAFGAYVLFMGKSDDTKIDDDDKKENIEASIDKDDADVNENSEVGEHADPAYDPDNDAGEQQFVDDDSTEAIAVPFNWKAVVNKSQGYTAYRPSNFYYRIFSGNVLGIDPNPIPEVGEYVGLISLFISTDSLNNEIDRAKDIITTESVSNVTYANGKWTIVTGLVPEDEMFPARFAYYAITEVEDKVCLVTYMVEGESNYNQYLETAKNFTEYIVWKIIE